jgi:P4 family phage/plasmid primase-like protien
MSSKYITSDRTEIRRALGLILEPGQVTELRALDVVEQSGYRRPHPASGYFDDLDKMASAAASLNARGVYFVPNPILPACLARANNRLRHDIGRDASTSDSEILVRRWLLVDLDPDRLAGISSSDTEHQESLALAQAMETALVAEGWPVPIRADSGNGAHLLWRLPDLPIPEKGKAGPDDIIARALVALAMRFDTPKVHVDKGVFNPSRIWKLYGTPARKGDPTDDRPHRIARVLAAPEKGSVLPLDVLTSLAEKAPREEQRREERRTPSAGRPAHPPAQQQPIGSSGGEAVSRGNLDEERPGDAFNRRGDLREVLRRNGWTLVQSGENEHWARPGKTGGTSATLKDGVFYVFSSSAAPLEANKGYSAFQVLTMLEHGGDHTAAARSLGAEGFGAKRTGRRDADEAPPVDPSWVEKVLPEKMRHVAGLAGEAKTTALEQLFGELAMQLAEASAVVQSAVKEMVCDKFDLPRRTYDRQLAESRLKAGRGWTNEATHFSLARQFMIDMGPDRELRLWRETWYEWNKQQGCYRERSDAWILNRISGWLMVRGLNVTAQLQTNILRALSPFCFVDYEARPPCWLRNAGGEWVKDDRGGIWVSFTNGLVNITDAALDPVAHTQHWFGLVSLPCKFDLHAECPTWMTALNTWQPRREISLPEYDVTPAHCRDIEDTQVDGTTVTKYFSRENQSLLQEFAGYIFEPLNPRQVFLLNLGDGQDGKSTWSGVIRELLGHANVAAVGLEAFDAKKDFNLEPLLGKMLNITGDANEMERMTEGALKSISGGDACTIKRKFKSAITEVLSTKFILNCNTPPPFRDRTDGIWRRMLLVRWDNQIANDQIDPHLQQKIIDNEMAGVFNWALNGFHAVRSGGFSRGATLASAIAAVKEGTQKEQAYFSERIEFDTRPNTAGDGPEYWLYKEAVIEDYKLWCEENNERRGMYGSNLMIALARYVRRRWPKEFAGLAQWAQSSIDKSGFRAKNKLPPRRIVLRGIRMIKQVDEDAVKAGATALGLSFPP